MHVRLSESLILVGLAFGALNNASAQCYEFASANSSLRLNLTNLPTPMILPSLGGGTQYTYNITTESGNTATVTRVRPLTL